MIGSILGGALGIGSAIFGGISASKAMKKVKASIEGQQAENESWYNRNYNADATQRADAQRVYAKMDEQLRQRNRQAEATRAVMGGTEESVAAEKAAASEAMAEAASQIAVNGERRKDQVEQQYMQNKSDLNAQLNNLEAGKAQEAKQAAQAGITAGANLIGLF